MRPATASAPLNVSNDPWRTWGVTVKRLVEEAPNVFTIELAFNDQRVASEYRFEPGQFNMLYVPGVGESAISIAGQTSAKTLQHSIRAVGSVTRAIQRGGVGMQLGLRGPFGTSWHVATPSAPATPQDLIIAAGGIGLAPLKAMIASVVHNRTQFDRVSVLIGARTPADLLYHLEYDLWRQAAIDVQLTVDRPDDAWTGHVGVVTLLLERLSVPHPTTTRVFTCGPEVMMRYVAKSAESRGIPSKNIWVTLERHMNCAIGLCGHCQLGPEFICKDGPVLGFDRVRRWLSVYDL